MPATSPNRFSDADISKAEAVSIADLAVERGLVLKRSGRELVGPCPLSHCGGNDRFSIHTTKDLFNCRGCGGKGRGAIAFVMFLDGSSFRDAVETLVGALQAPVRQKPVAVSRNSAAYDRRQREKAAWFWSQRLPITGSIAERYLREVRGIACALPPTLGFLPSKRDHHPALISAFGLCDEIEPGIIAAPREVVAVHLTKLKPDGSGKVEVEKPESNKIIIASPSGWPIIIAPPNDLLGLAITEGIEDALSVHQATGLGAWVAGSAPHMSKLGDAVPGYIDCVSIFTDADADRQGERNAALLAERLCERGIEVTVEGIAS
jgi:hypothetical protein